MTTESSRLDMPAFQKLAPETWRSLIAISTAAMQSGLGTELIHFIKLRASRVNGCHFCLAMHTGEARKNGISEERLAAIEHWRDSSIFTPRERAALAWTDALTRLVNADVPDALYREVSSLYSEAELAALTSVVVAINSWNRIAVGFRFQPEALTEARR